MTAKSPIIRTSHGFVRGAVRTTGGGKDYFSFQGIPYVAPPVGELRFRDPQPVEPWTLILDATSESSPCPTLNLLAVTPEFDGEEARSLTVNIFTPTLKSWKPLPVFVFIHGGGFVLGSSSTLLYGPEYIVEKDVILVTFNYRLGVLGFLSLKDPAAGVPGNAGLKDQSMALRWIKENIKHFGGDPNNITISGESAGGASVHYHLISDMSEGLFQKAILQSGVALNPWATVPKPGPNFTVKLAQKLGYTGSIDNDVELLEFFQKQEVKPLVMGSFQLVDHEYALEFSYDLYCPFVPTVEPYESDMCFLPQDPLEMGRNAWSSDVDIIIGGCANEGYLFGSSITVDRVAKMRENNELFIPYNKRVTNPVTNAKEKGETIKDFYFKDKKVTVEAVEEFCRYYSDAAFWHGINRIVRQRLHSGGKGKTYLYRLNTSTSHDSFFGAMIRKMGNIPHNKGTIHGEDLTHLFSNKFDKRHHPGQSFYKTFQRFLGAFTKFAVDGEPSDQSFAPLKWSPVTLGNEKHCLDMGENIWELINYPGTKTLELWDSLYENDELY